MSGKILINKRQLAKELDVSLPTLTSWIEKYEDFPIVSRGRNGSSYKFDAEEVFPFLDQKKEEELEKNAGRDEALASLQLSFSNLFPDDDALPIQSREDIKKQLDIAKLHQLKRKEAQECGLLVPANEMRDALMSTFARLGSESRNFIKRFGTENGIPEAIIQHKIAMYEDLQKATVNDILGLLTPPEEQEHATQEDTHGLL